MLLCVTLLFDGVTTADCGLQPARFDRRHSPAPESAFQGCAAGQYSVCRGRTSSPSTTAASCSQLEGQNTSAESRRPPPSVTSGKQVRTIFQTLKNCSHFEKLFSLASPMSRTGTVGWFLQRRSAPLFGKKCRRLCLAKGCAASANAILPGSHLYIRFPGQEGRVSLILRDHRRSPATIPPTAITRLSTQQVNDICCTLNVINPRRCCYV